MWSRLLGSLAAATAAALLFLVGQWSVCLEERCCCCRCCCSGCDGGGGGIYGYIHIYVLYIYIYIGGGGYTGRPNVRDNNSTRARAQRGRPSCALGWFRCGMLLRCCWPLLLRLLLLSGICKERGGWGLAEREQQLDVGSDGGGRGRIVVVLLYSFGCTVY